MMTIEDKLTPPTLMVVATRHWIDEFGGVVEPFRPFRCTWKFFLEEATKPPPRHLTASLDKEPTLAEQARGMTSLVPPHKRSLVPLDVAQYDLASGEVRELELSQWALHSHAVRDDYPLQVKGYTSEGLMALERRREDIRRDIERDLLLGKIDKQELCGRLLAKIRGDA